MCEVNRCEGGPPRPALPPGPDTNEGDHAAVGNSAVAGHQFNSCVGNDYPPVFAQGRDLEQLSVESAGLHRLIETPPMQRPQYGRDNDIETLADRLVRRKPHDLGDCVTPLANNAVAIDGHTCAQVIASRSGSVHTLFTVRAIGRFTHVVVLLPRVP
jgi:hypothetical protein